MPAGEYIGIVTATADPDGSESDDVVFRIGTSAPYYTWIHRTGPLQPPTRSISTRRGQSGFCVTATTMTQTPMSRRRPCPRYRSTPLTLRSHRQVRGTRVTALRSRHAQITLCRRRGPWPSFVFSFGAGAARRLLTQRDATAYKSVLALRRPSTLSGSPYPLLPMRPPGHTGSISNLRCFGSSRMAEWLRGADSAVYGRFMRSRDGRGLE